MSKIREQLKPFSQIFMMLGISFVTIVIATIVNVINNDNVFDKICLINSDIVFVFINIMVNMLIWRNSNKYKNSFATVINITACLIEAFLYGIMATNESVEKSQWCTSFASFLFLSVFLIDIIIVVGQFIKKIKDTSCTKKSNINRGRSTGHVSDSIGYNKGDE